MILTRRAVAASLTTVLAALLLAALAPAGARAGYPYAHYERTQSVSFGAGTPELTGSLVSQIDVVSPTEVNLTITIHTSTTGPGGEQAFTAYGCPTAAPESGPPFCEGQQRVGSVTLSTGVSSGTWSTTFTDSQPIHEIWVDISPLGFKHYWAVHRITYDDPPPPAQQPPAAPPAPPTAPPVSPPAPANPRPTPPSPPAESDAPSSPAPRRAAGDHAPPRLSQLRIVRRRISVRTSEAATIRLRLVRCTPVKRHGHHGRRHARRDHSRRGRRAARRCRGARLRADPRHAGRVTRRIPRRLRAGRYRLTVTAVDRAGNRSRSIGRTVGLRAAGRRHRR